MLRLPRPFKLPELGRYVYQRYGRSDLSGSTGLIARKRFMEWKDLFSSVTTEHHFAPYPMALRSELGLTEWSTSMAFGYA